MRAQKVWNRKRSARISTTYVKTSGGYDAKQTVRGLFAPTSALSSRSIAAWVRQAKRRVVDAVAPEHLATVKVAIEIASPVKFDVVRQVRVFEPYLQYVELYLAGAAVQRQREQSENENRVTDKQKKRGAPFTLQYAPVEPDLCRLPCEVPDSIGGPEQADDSLLPWDLAVAALVKARADLQMAQGKVRPRSDETRLHAHGAAFHSVPIWYESLLPCVWP